MGYPLRETCVELSRLINIKPTDVLLHDAVEKQLADAFDLPPSCQCPERHLQVSCHQHDSTHDGVVDGIAERREERRGTVTNMFAKQLPKLMKLIIDAILYDKNKTHLHENSLSFVLRCSTQKLLNSVYAEHKVLQMHILF